MKRDYARLIRAATRARGENALDRVVDGVLLWLRDAPKDPPKPRARRVNVRPVEVVEAELIDE